MLNDKLPQRQLANSRWWRIVNTSKQQQPKHFTYSMETVFFKSEELEHEVLVTQERRMSVTGRLKR